MIYVGKSVPVSYTHLDVYKRQVLYWHWSPNYNFQINHQLQGYDETLMTYILAAASPNYSIEKSVYEQGWARNGGIKSSGSQYGIPLVVNHNGANLSLIHI